MNNLSPQEIQMYYHLQQKIQQAGQGQATPQYFQQPQEEKRKVSVKKAAKKAAKPMQTDYYALFFFVGVLCLFIIYEAFK
jgi:hypothetical protein